ncbi:hypothetical protein ACFPYN_06020 [Paenisporosarcina macmurdoensis]|uniref:DUF350 domain-containing protein n=1 Tax=Paenisporosarcina macmurdoensis TaxID=212659 RepID=A0ABW1L4V6_9BACL
METETYIKDTPMLLMFGLIFLTVFGLWLIKRVISYDFNNKSTFSFLWNNSELIGGSLLGIGLLIIVVFF